SGNLDQRDEGIVEDAAPEFHRPVEIKQQNDALFIRVVPHFMLIGVVEHEDLTRTPDLDLVVDADAALLGVLRNDETEMGAQDSLGYAAMGRNVVARPQ